MFDNGGGFSEADDAPPPEPVSPESVSAEPVWPEPMPEPWNRPDSAVRPDGYAALELQSATGNPTQLTDAEVIEAIRGYDHVASWAAARQARMLAEFAHRRPPDRTDVLDRVTVGPVSAWAPDEVGLALTLSRGTAAARLERSLRLTQVLPATLAAWDAGRIDQAKVAAIHDATLALSDTAAQAVQDRVLPTAPTQTLAQLRAALERAVIATDPAGADARHRKAHRQRRVALNPDRDGMASLWALLSAPDALTCYGWLTALARGLPAADARSMDARRADLLVALLTGNLLLRPTPDHNPPATDPPATDPPATDPPATDPPATDPPATDPPATDPPATGQDTAGGDAAGQDVAAGGDAAGGDAAGGDAAGGDAVGGDAVGGDAVGGDAVGGDAVGGDAVGGDAVGGDRGGDAAGGDAAGGDAAGGDAVGQDVTGGDRGDNAAAGGDRGDHAAAESAGAESAGAESCGKRPAAAAPTGGGVRAGAGSWWVRTDLPTPVAPTKPLVQVVIPLTTLTGADDSPVELTGYGPLPPAMARALAADGVWKRLITDPLSGALLDHGRHTYRPPAALAEFLRARDRHCRVPICRRRALDSQLDHTIGYHTHHGTTDQQNLYNACLCHHRMKDAPGWSVTQHSDGRLTWTTPTGHRYSSRPFDYRPEPDLVAAITALDQAAHDQAAHDRASAGDTARAAADRASGSPFNRPTPPADPADPPPF